MPNTILYCWIFKMVPQNVTAKDESNDVAHFLNGVLGANVIGSAFFHGLNHAVRG